ncbi:hypothetical protein K1T71_007519 [Dendrolimus kikuchii]|uniref:Uncharacterized protein n=1 Tax=Dendrolimus kikuchii TaxID=765133 RepID=A0ACC1D0V3_9NEOP|nr:hypothetical protein K1T71_007519 [Dendrolimus kikuchii]
MGAKFKMWCVLVCLWGAVAYAEIGNNMNNISQKLMTDLSDVMEMASVNYSEPVINTTYTASIEFDMRAMGPLYNSTHMVIDVIANKQAYPEVHTSCFARGYRSTASSLHRPLLYTAQMQYVRPAAWTEFPRISCTLNPNTWLMITTQQ